MSDFKCQGCGQLSGVPNYTTDGVLLCATCYTEVPREPVAKGDNLAPVVDIDVGRPHVQGPARCAACGHGWRAVAPVGDIADFASFSPTNLECPSCHAMAGSFDDKTARMSEEEFERITAFAVPSQDLADLIAEARRARDGEEIEARRANGAELLVDAKDVEIAALKDEIQKLKIERAACHDIHVGTEESLIVQRDKAEAERDIERTSALNYAAAYDTQTRLRDKAESRAERYREALEKIASNSSGGLLDTDEARDRHAMIHVARAALGEEGK